MAELMVALSTLGLIILRRCGRREKVIRRIITSTPPTHCGDSLARHQSECPDYNTLFMLVLHFGIEVDFRQGVLTAWKGAAAALVKAKN